MIPEIVTVPGGARLCGTLAAISSKSDLHRLIVCACLIDPTDVSGTCRIRFHAVPSKDIEATVGCLRALGAGIDLAFDSASSTGEITVSRPVTPADVAPGTMLDCGESGSTARFLLPFVSLCGNNVGLTGHGKLPERPFEELCTTLTAHGARFDAHRLPLRVQQAAAPSGLFEIRGDVSSQYITGLLFILPLCGAQGLRLTTTLESAGYVDLTADALRRFGVTVKRDGALFFTEGRYAAPRVPIDAEGDWSNAAFWLCGVRDTDEITLTGLDLSSFQPDRRICDILRRMGMTITTEENRVTASAPRGTHGVAFDARDIPDLVPVLCVRAAASGGDTVISGTRRLRIKESDRVQAVCELITRIGGDIRADEDHIYIHGTGSLSGGDVNSFGDHRIAMSAAVAAAFCKAPVAIHGARAVEKSYPQFFEHFKALSGAAL